MKLDIDPKAFSEAIEQIAYDRKIPKERIFETVASAIAAAYRKDYGYPEQHVRADFNPENGETKLFIVHELVAKKDDVENEHVQMTVTEARKQGVKSPKAGENWEEPVEPPSGFGRIAAQTAKQVIIQRIREVEREIVRDEFTDRTGELMTGSVQRIEGRNVFVEVGRAVGVLAPGDQIERERYYIGQRLRVMLREVDPEGRAAQLLLTRSHPDFVRRLFELEVPEIHAGTVEIKSVAREAGVRSKVAVASNQEGVDPVGTCVGQRGTRVQAIMAELGDEKIDIVLFDEDSKTYIENALSPAKISKIELDEKTKTATLKVADDQLSLAIGRGGQNVRLAGDLTGWQIDIDKSESQRRAGEGEDADASGVIASIPIGTVDGVTEDEAKAFDGAKLESAQKIVAAEDADLDKIKSVEPDRRKEIQQLAAQAVSEADDGGAGEPDADKASKDEKEDKDAPADPKESDGDASDTADTKGETSAPAKDAQEDAPVADTGDTDEASGEKKPAEKQAQDSEEKAEPSEDEKKPE
ncbi:MAG TPA: transcription termination factor NusA [Patescibacteria group bacterium]|jgi:N utilization substance protein A